MTEESKPPEEIELPAQLEDDTRTTVCPTCGAVVWRRAGSCFVCGNCGETTGGCG